MTTGFGDAVSAPATACAPTPRVESQWSTRVLAAVGGAVVVVWVLLLATVWTTGLRASSFDALRSDLASGSVRQWYAASSLDTGMLDSARAEQAGTAGGVVDPAAEGGFATPDGFPDGGILVWRTWGEPGWSVASPDGSIHPPASASPTEESTALVRQLRDAQVPMRPFAFSERTPLELVQIVGGLLVLARLVLGPATRVGTKWFWLWLFVGAPLALGVVAYAVTELVGLRRRPDRPPDRRFRGVFGFVAGLLLTIGVGLGAGLLGSWGVPLPF